MLLEYIRIYRILAILPLRRVTWPPDDLQKLHPGRVLQTSQPDRSKSDSEWVTAISTRNAPSLSTDRPGTGSDRIWVRSFANTGQNMTGYKKSQWDSSQQTARIPTLL